MRYWVRNRQRVLHRSERQWARREAQGSGVCGGIVRARMRGGVQRRRRRELRAVHRELGRRRASADPAAGREHPFAVPEGPLRTHIAKARPVTHVAPWDPDGAIAGRPFPVPWHPDIARASRGPRLVARGWRLVERRSGGALARRPPLLRSRRHSGRCDGEKDTDAAGHLRPTLWEKACHAQNSAWCGAGSPPAGLLCI